MKSDRHWIGYSVPSLLLTLCSLGFSGCSTQLIDIKIAEPPCLQTGSPLKSVSPLRVCLRHFQDLRGAQSDVMFSPWFRLDKPVATLVRDSIRREFERNGHICLGPEQEGEADVIMDGSVYQYSLVFEQPITGNVGAKISLRPAKDPEIMFVRKYDGTFYAPNKWRVTIDTVTRIQNEALLNMIKELTNDEEFLQFLRRHAGVAPEQ